MGGRPHAARAPRPGRPRCAHRRPQGRRRRRRARDSHARARGGPHAGGAEEVGAHHRARSRRRRMAGTRHRGRSGVPAARASRGLLRPDVVARAAAAADPRRRRPRHDARHGRAQGRRRPATAVVGAVARHGGQRARRARRGRPSRAGAYRVRSVARAVDPLVVRRVVPPAHGPLRAAARARRARCGAHARRHPRPAGRPRRPAPLRRHRGGARRPRRAVGPSDARSRSRLAVVGVPVGVSRSRRRALSRGPRRRRAARRRPHVARARDLLAHPRPARRCDLLALHVATAAVVGQLPGERPRDAQPAAHRPAARS